MAKKLSSAKPKASDADADAPLVPQPPLVLAAPGPLPPLPTDTPSNQAYPELNVAFHFFNHALFQGQLPFPMFVLHRSDRYLGHFSPKRYVNRTEHLADEIMLNASSFALNSVEDIMSTLVHEMVHQLQNHAGSAGRRGYHNAEWAKMMIDRGLCPSSTGREGGKQTGESMSHYIIEGGPFQIACRELLQDHQGVVWFDRHLVRRDKLVVLSYPKDAPNDQPSKSPPAPQAREVDPGTDGPTPPPVRESLDLSPADEADDPAAQHSSFEPLAAGNSTAPAQELYSDDLPPTRPGAVAPPMAPRTKPLSADLPTLSLVASPPAPSKQNRAKFACPEAGCKTAVWGKPSVFVICGDHAQRLLDVTATAVDQSGVKEDDPPQLRAHESGPSDAAPATTPDRPSQPVADEPADAATSGVETDPSAHQTLSDATAEALQSDSTGGTTSSPGPTATHVEPETPQASQDSSSEAPSAYRESQSGPSSSEPPTPQT